MDDIKKLLSSISARAETFVPLSQASVTHPSDESELDPRIEAREEQVGSKAPAGSRTPPESLRQADIAILAALPSPELEQVVPAFGGTWTKEGREGVVYSVLDSE